jgi:uncharacterized RmlC-like cupin family protein
MDWKEHGVKIVHAGELDMNTPQTSGMTRAAAITHARTGAETMCWHDGRATGCEDGTASSW